jgi:hypothetical protein
MAFVIWHSWHSWHSSFSIGHLWCAVNLRQRCLCTWAR